MIEKKEEVNYLFFFLFSHGGKYCRQAKLVKKLEKSNFKNGFFSSKIKGFE